MTTERTDSPSEPTLRIGLVGAGFLAATRARCWKRVHGVRVELVAVSSREAAKAKAFAAEHGVGRTSSTGQIIAADDIDLVDLCVPNAQHRPFAEAAARAGKSILCTKPLAAYVGQDLEDASAAKSTARADMLRVAVGDARAMVDAAIENGVRLHYGENWIFAPGMQRAAELARKSKGRILEMRGWESHSGSHSPYAKEWRHTGGGALIRLASHPIGTMLWLKREEARARGTAVPALEWVTAEVGDPTTHPALAAKHTRVATGWNGVESTASITLGFSDGSRGYAQGSDLMLGGMQSRLVVLASDAHLEVNLSPHDLVKSYAAEDRAFGDAYMLEKASTQAGWNTPLPDEDWTSGHQGLVQAVAEAERRGEACTSDGQLGLAVTRAVYAGYVSAAEGRRVSIEAG